MHTFILYYVYSFNNNDVYTTEYENSLDSLRGFSKSLTNKIVCPTQIQTHKYVGLFMLEV